MNASELYLNRLNTRRFIEDDPVDLILYHRAKINTGDGGWRWSAPVPRAPQTFRLIPQSDTMPQVQNPDGHLLTPRYVLLGEHTAIMSRWDTFTFNGVDFQIVGPIRPDFTIENVYERKGDVARV